MSPMPQSPADRSENSGSDEAGGAAEMRSGNHSIGERQARATVANSRADGVAEHVGPRQQADDEVAVAREVEEVAGVHEHVLFLEQPDHALVFRHRVRHANHGRPAAFGAQHLAGGVRLCDARCSSR